MCCHKKKWVHHCNSLTKQKPKIAQRPLLLSLIFSGKKPDSVMWVRQHSSHLSVGFISHSSFYNSASTPFTQAHMHSPALLTAASAIKHLQNKQIPRSSPIPQFSPCPCVHASLPLPLFMHPLNADNDRHTPHPSPLPHRSCWCLLTRRSSWWQHSRTGPQHPISPQG